MIRWIAAALPTAALLLVSVVSRAEDEFVTVDPATLESVSGKTLMMICYGIIGGMILLYSIFLFMRERSSNRRIEDLKKRVGPVSPIGPIPE